MKLGYIGLGKMGGNMVERLLDYGYEVVVHSSGKKEVDQAVKKGATSGEGVEGLVGKLDENRLIWIMVPWQEVDAVLERLMPYLSAGDTVIDGGNSPYKKSIERSSKLKQSKINFLDVGVSGGPHGARNGACMMIGGIERVYKKYEQFFADLCVDDGYGYMGRSGAGHYVKMVHNGIEYGMMQAIAEGFALMRKSNMDLDLEKVAKVYSKGSVIESQLIDWLVNGYARNGVELDGISGEVAHSGEGLWTVKEAKELGVDVKVIKKSLKFRKKSIGNPSYTGKVLSVLRSEFGGHDVNE